jgi:hypothetical protein
MENLGRGKMTLLLIVVTAGYLLLFLGMERSATFPVEVEVLPTSLIPVSTPHHTDIFHLETFIETFEAARPEWTERCRAYLRSPAQYNSDRSSFINWKWEFSQ